MELKTIVEFWRDQRKSGGRWFHPADVKVLDTYETSFNLDFPISPYVGDVENAPVVILNANAGYNELSTPAEFGSQTVIDEYLEQVRHPSSAAWSVLSPYYLSRNYGDMIRAREAVVVNASPYRSRKISNEPANKAAIEALPSTKFHRLWLQEALIPAVIRSDRLVIAHRWGLWKIKASQRLTSGLLFDLKCRAFPDVDASLLAETRQFVMRRRSLGGSGSGSTSPISPSA